MQNQFCCFPRHAHESQALRQRHQREAEEFYQRKGLSMSHLMSPLLSSAPTTSPPLFMETLPASPFHIATSHHHLSTPATSVEGIPGSPSTLRRGLMEGALRSHSPTPEKARRGLKMEDMLKYVDFTAAPLAGSKPDSKKTLNMLKLEKDLKGWEAGQPHDSASGAHGGSRLEPPEQPLDHGSNSGSRRSSTDLSASQSSIQELLRQQQQSQSQPPGGAGLLQPGVGQYIHQPMGHHHQQMSHHMSQLSSMLSTSPFPPYMYAYGGPYHTYHPGGVQSHPPTFSVTGGSLFKVPTCMGQTHLSAQLPASSAAVGLTQSSVPQPSVAGEEAVGGISSSVSTLPLPDQSQGGGQPGASNWHSDENTTSLSVSVLPHPPHMYTGVYSSSSFICALYTYEQQHWHSRLLKKGNQCRRRALYNANRRKLFSSVKNSVNVFKWLFWGVKRERNLQ